MREVGRAAPVDLGQEEEFAEMGPEAGIEWVVIGMRGVEVEGRFGEGKDGAVVFLPSGGGGAGVA